MPNIKLTIGFDGTHYHGWQRQHNAVTVESTLLGAFMRVGTVDTLIGCSRTDAGVHALRYVCNAHVDTRVPVDKLHIVLNTMLPPDIRVYAAESVADEFHARYDATGKTYAYNITYAPVCEPHLRLYAHHFAYAIDVSAMQTAASHMTGTHDYRCFMATGSSHKTFTRTLDTVEVTHDASEKRITIRTHANAYLYNMVRIIAGTLLYCGIGRIDPADIPDILSSRDRTRAGITLPPHGLRLVSVDYPVPVPVYET